MTTESGRRKGLPPAQKVRLGSAVEYQVGSVVSRTIIESNAGTITLFAFDLGEGLSEHTAPFDALIQVIDGSAEVTISGEPHRLDSGESIILPAGEPHSLRAPQRFKMLLTMIRR